MTTNICTRCHGLGVSNEPEKPVVLDWRDYYNPHQPVIYIAGPYSAPTDAEIDLNVNHARRVRDELVAKGWAVICPHANTAYMDNAHPDVYYTMDLAMLARCDAIMMLDGWEKSKGARMEFAFALTRTITVHMEVYMERDGAPVPLNAHRVVS